MWRLKQLVSLLLLSFLPIFCSAGEFSAGKNSLNPKDCIGISLYVRGGETIYGFNMAIDLGNPVPGSLLIPGCFFDVYQIRNICPIKSGLSTTIPDDPTKYVVKIPKFRLMVDPSYIDANIKSQDFLNLESNRLKIEAAFRDSTGREPYWKAGTLPLIPYLYLDHTAYKINEEFAYNDTIFPLFIQREIVEGRLADEQSSDYLKAVEDFRVFQSVLTPIVESIGLTLDIGRTKNSIYVSEPEEMLEYGLSRPGFMYFDWANGTSE